MRDVLIGEFESALIFRPEPASYLYVQMHLGVYQTH